jgi:subtilisin-like proprotein convertase family protein
MSLAGGSADPRNNVESVYLPAQTAGRISVTVRGTTIAGDGVPGNGDSTDQDFGLVVSNAQAQAGPVLVDGATDLDQSGPGDHDGALESGEEVDMTEHVHNAGSGSAGGLSAELHGGTGVNVTQGTSTYPDIAAGDTQANDTPFALQLANGATCGQDASATLDITSTTPAETQTIPLVLPTGEPGPSQTTSAASPNVPVTIPDDSAPGASSSVLVAQRGRIKDVNVTLGSAGSPGITHTWDGDLVIDLIGPDGTTVRLADHPGGPDNSGDNFAGTVFDDEASQTIGAVGTSAPYTGDFKPQHDQLSRFDGKDRRGTWMLRVRDLFKGDSGSIQGWGLTTQKALCDFDTVAPSTSIDSGPANPVSSASATFSFSSDDQSATFECRLDSAAYEPCSSPKTYQGVPDGVRTFQVRAIDGSDNEDPNPPVYSWVVDTTPPETTIGSGPSGVVGARDATFGFSSEPGATFECSLDGGAFTACSSPASYGGLGDGGHSFRVRARDTLGNLETTPAATSWTVDTTSPATAILSPSPGSTTQDATPLLRGTAGTASGDDGVVTVELFKGALAAGLPAQTMIVPRDGASGSWSARPRALGEGSYTVRVVQHDSVGHVGTSASTFSVVPPGFVLAPGEVRLADALANRITVLAACASSCEASAKLTVSGRAARRLGLTARSAVALGTGSRRISRAGAAALRLRLSARARRALRGRATATAVLAVTVTRVGHFPLSAKRAMVLKRSAGLRSIAGHGLRLWAVCEASCPLSGALTLSAAEARRLGLRARGSARVTIGSGRSAASSAGAALTLKVRSSARKALSRARVARGLVEVAAGSTSELRRTATLPVTLRR